MDRSSAKRLSPLLVLVLLFNPSKKFRLLSAMEEEVVVVLAIIALLLFSLPLLGFKFSSPASRAEKLVGASLTRGVLGKERVRSKVFSSIESIPESFEPLAVSGFDFGRSDRVRCGF